jgi:hypothetical protein
MLFLQACMQQQHLLNLPPKQRTALAISLFGCESLLSLFDTCASIPCGNTLLEEASLAWR